MKTNEISYHGYRFPREVISHGVWLYHRFSLSLRDVEELLAKQGILVSHETIRQWCRKFGPAYARRLKRREGRLGGYCQLELILSQIDIRPRRKTPEYRHSPSCGSRGLLQISLKLTVPYFLVNSVLIGV
jgi:hypothetical protein